MSKFYVHKLMCLKHILLISLLSITSIVILGCTCSKTEEPVQEPEQAIKEEPVKKEPVKEEPVELKAVEKPESIESGKADSTETVKATPSQRPESNEAEPDATTVPLKIETNPIPSRENPLEKEYGDVHEEEGAQVEEERDPCEADCMNEYTFCQEDCHRLDDQNEIPLCVEDCRTVAVDCVDKCRVR
ncbi:MAG: hypothetical protein WBD99_10215 [Thermodesulfobacteriota bacterium]